MSEVNAQVDYTKEVTVSCVAQIIKVRNTNLSLEREGRNESKLLDIEENC